MPVLLVPDFAKTEYNVQHYLINFSWRCNINTSEILNLYLQKRQNYFLFSDYLIST